MKIPEPPLAEGLKFIHCATVHLLQVLMYGIPV